MITRLDDVLCYWIGVICPGRLGGEVSASSPFAEWYARSCRTCCSQYLVVIGACRHQSVCFMIHLQVVFKFENLGGLGGQIAFYVLHFEELSRCSYIHPAFGAKGTFVFEDTSLPIPKWELILLRNCLVLSLGGTTHMSSCGYC